jgi:hypothetical protein
MRGIAAIPSEELERLAEGIERGLIRCPPNDSDLRSHGHPVDPLRALLDGLDPRAATRVLRAIVADRTERPTPRLDLVWTGPEMRVAHWRDTAVLVREMFANARREVLVAGFTFDHGATIFEPLHSAMCTHGVAAEFYLDIPRASPGDDMATYVRDFAARFLRQNWPFGDPKPALFHDPRTVDPGALVSLHAKCIVVDCAQTLVTSANFTDRGQTRNVELGVRIKDETFSQKVASHWRSLAEHGEFARIPRAD